ncbi:MAG TPA: TonB-dependent receptor [Bryobacteraceae bacterium]|nr:TonB-dependent receptor [Bryobacteraceae bacterium]
MRRCICSTLLSAFVLSLLCLMPASAQNGSVSGTVTDTGKGVLKGANVDIQPSGKPTATDNQGEFTIVGLAPGEYILTISYVGLDPFSQKLTVTAGQTTRVEAELKVATQANSVTVTAERVHGEAEAINRERTAENILQVLPHDVIVSLPNANVADAIGRMPSVTIERDEGEGKYVQVRGTEPRYTNVTVDGVNLPAPEGGTRQIKLDVIPSDLVESVEINKTLLANMDGDGIGGSVNLRTKTAGEQPTISLFGIGGHTPILDGRNAYQSGATIGKRFGKEKKLGVLFGFAYDWNGRGIDDVEPSPLAIQCSPGNCGSPSANAPYFGTYNNEGIREYRYYRTRYGFTGSIDYKFSDNFNIWIRGLYSHFDNWGDRSEITPQINSFTTSPYQGGADGNATYDTEIRRPVEVIGSLATGGRRDFGTAWLIWEFSVGRSSAEDHGYSTATFVPGPNSPINAVQYGLNFSNPYVPVFNVQNGVNIYDATQYYLQGLDIGRSYSPQVNINGAVSLAKQYHLGGHYGTFEVGGKLRNAHKFQEFKDPVYTAINPTQFALSSFPVSLQNKTYYNGYYTAPALYNYSSILAAVNGNPNAFSVDYSPLNQVESNNDIIERVGAGYVMNTINFDRWRLNTGIRFETTTEYAAGYQVITDPNNPLGYSGVTPLHVNSTRVDPLPSAELRYRTTSDSDIRFAYGRGVARPQFGDLAPSLTVDDANKRISVGNPALKATHADNFDVLFEEYLKPIGLLQGGFFYKRIDLPIYPIETLLTSGPYTGFRQDQPQNGTNAWLYGFETAYQQHLGFLPGLLNGLGISANYSYTASQANGVPNRTDNPRLIRQAPNTWNLSPTFDRGRLSMRLGVSYNQAFIDAYNYQDGAPLGVNGPNGDHWFYTHLQVDAQGSYRLNKGFTVVVYGLNLTNEVFGFYYGSPIWDNQREFYKPTVGVGLRWASGGEHN